MKITFPDKSYIEISKSNKPNHFFISIVAKDPKVPLATIANTVEISREQLEELKDFIEK